MNKTHPQTVKATAALAAAGVVALLIFGPAREGEAERSGVQRLPTSVVDKSADSAARLERLIVLHRGW
ncbi:MAG TPA: hypothetical protein PK620_06285 [Denitromonas sp.]|uniref:hypothetical protein n=1 Tax=Denitromonas sp. TaxID=2734609 RepID=UPI001DF60B8B|nr:hypothetical protein [Rhodocyclaceae bacterium]MCP5221601.1 hypothetical protein [Zoogloeaceae bacterium]HPR05161.1 hypothetical protein [Denitromonas sp.]HQU88249.1 hypothetical protein [Denitromonas sp.]HQV14504.1 hypothetical protein [Denitromonas sp.]